MSVPGFQEFMYPFLEILSDENEHSLQEIYTILATRYNLNEEDLTELIPPPTPIFFVVPSTNIRFFHSTTINLGQPSFS